MANKRTKALQAAEEAVREIAALNDWPPPPGEYPRIKRQWKRMVTVARRAVKKLDELGPDDL